MPYWAHPQNQIYKRSTCRCFVFYARKTPGFGGVWRFGAQKIDTVVRLNLNELVELKIFSPLFENGTRISGFNDILKNLSRLILGTLIIQNPLILLVYDVFWERIGKDSCVLIEHSEIAEIAITF